MEQLDRDTNPADPFDTVPVRLAHAILKAHVPGAAFDGEPFMVTGIGRWLDQTEFAVCNCFYHSVAFVKDKAFVFSREEGGMIPWVGEGNVVVPDPDYFERAIRLPEGTSALMLQAVQEQVAKAASVPPARVSDAPGM